MQHKSVSLLSCISRTAVGLWLMLLPTFVFCQSFHITVTLPPKTTGAVTLTIYDSYSHPRHMTASKGKGNTCDFTGTVKQPTYAELQLNNGGEPLQLFVENANISILFDKENPNASRVTGSRSNSQIRYQMELCGDNPEECLATHIAEHTDSPLTPFLLNRLMDITDEPERIRSLHQQLNGQAKETYHYTLLTERLKRQETLAAGNPLPYFRYFDDNQKLVAIDTVLAADTTGNIILVGASWCIQCGNIINILRNNYSDIPAVVINIDKQHKKWDCNVVEFLDIEHIPFLVLVDAKSHIVARDFRIWELDRILKASDMPHAGSPTAATASPAGSPTAAAPSPADDTATAKQ